MHTTGPTLLGVACLLPALAGAITRRKSALLRPLGLGAILLSAGLLLAHSGGYEHLGFGWTLRLDPGARYLALALLACGGLSLSLGPVALGLVSLGLLYVLAADLRLAVLPWLILLALCPGRRELRALAGLMMLGCVVFAVAQRGGLAEPAPLRSLLQLRLLGGFAGAAVLAAAATLASFRSGGLLLAVASVYGLLRFVGPICPDALRLSVPALAWALPAVAVALLVAGRWRPRAHLLLPLLAAVLGLVSGTEPGVEGAILLLAATLVVVVGLHHAPEAPLGVGALGLPGSLGFAGAWLALGAAARAVGPVSLELSASICAAALLPALLLSLRSLKPAALAPVLGFAVCLVLGGVLPLLDAARPSDARQAAALSEVAVPVDDPHGWRRLHQLHRRRAQPDAGP